MKSRKSFALACAMLATSLAGCAAPRSGAAVEPPQAALPAPPPAAVTDPQKPTPTPTPKPQPTQFASLTVTVEGVLPAKSRLLVGLFDAASYSGLHPPYHNDLAAVSPKTIVRFADVKPGRYAVKILQDLNGNHVVDKTLIGVPEEPFGLSNDIKPKLAEPGFGETSFTLKPGANAIVIHLQQM